MSIIKTHKCFLKLHETEQTSAFEYYGSREKSYVFHCKYPRCRRMWIFTFSQFWVGRRKVEYRAQH